MRNECELADYFLGYHLHHIIVSGLLDSWTSTLRQILHKIVAGGDIWHALCVHCFLYRISYHWVLVILPVFFFPWQGKAVCMQMFLSWDTGIQMCSIVEVLPNVFICCDNTSITTQPQYTCSHSSMVLSIFTFLQFISCFISLYQFIYNAWQPFTMVSVVPKKIIS